MSAVRFFYNLAFPFVLVALLPGFLLRMVRRGKYRHKFGQRFAIYSPRVRQKLARGGATWIHAVSVGEVLIATKLIREMKRRDPSLRVVLSTTTSTGFALAVREKSEWLEPIYNPLDFLWTVRHAVRLVRPRRLILVEAEIWPNLTAEAKKIGATLTLVNARLSARSESRYRLVRPIVSVIFNELDFVCVQEPADAARWQALGVPAGKIVCTGSIKFDDRDGLAEERRDFRPDLKKLGCSDDAPVILAGSTHAGEERIVGEIVQRLKKDFPGIFDLVVPRHAERWREVRDELTATGLRVAVRKGDDTPPERPDTLLANTTGELRDWYDSATVVFVGKSLLARGGQNPAEALAAGKPVVVGPHMENFSSLAGQLIRADGLVQVRDADEMEQAFRHLLSDSARRAAISANGVKCLQTHRGATVRTCEVLEKLDSQAVAVSP
jgi:3-deoxy-D-manno-octulosonic-acid transferase